MTSARSAVDVVPAGIRPSRRPGGHRRAPGHGPPHRNGRGRPADAGVASRWGLLPQFLAVMAAGVLLVALAYQRGWEQSAGGQVLYWAGELLIFLPATARMISRSQGVGRWERLGLVLGVTAALYAVKYLYSPLAFKFPDELQHWRSATDIATTQHLFTANFSLPISPRFPGLEELTTALSSLSGLSIVSAGLLVAGIARLLLMLGLFELFRRVGGGGRPGADGPDASATAASRYRAERVAGFAALLYATSMHFQFFDAMFIYQALAVPLAVVVLVLLARPADPDRPTANRARLWIAVALTAAVVATHHVTGFVLFAVLALWALVQWAGSRHATGWPRDRRPLLLAGACAVFLLLWDGLVATDTISYLTPILDTFRDLFGAGGQPATSTAPVPLFDQLTSYGAVVVVAVLLPPAAWYVWRAQRQQPAAVVLTFASLSYYLVLGVRLASSDGSELAGRAFTYVYLPVAYVLAAGAVAALERARTARTARTAAPNATGNATRKTTRDAALDAGRAALGRPSVVAALTAVVFVGGITSGWPPYWERLPGPYQVAAFERSVEPEGIAAAQWTLSHLGPGNRFAADFTNYTLLGTYGGQDVVRNMADVYYSPTFGPAQVAQLADAGVEYLLVDLRLSTQLPAGGSYFPDDPQQGRHTAPIPRSSLTKFAAVTGIDRIYDSGNIVIYDVRGVLDASQ